MSPRARAFAPWLVVAAVITAGVCATAWPTATGWAVGATVGTWALYRGVRGLIRGPKNGTPLDDVAECAADDELTAEEARELAADLGLQLYRAKDALAYVAEMCDMADEHRGKRGEPATVTTTRVREWLKGAQCARQAGLVLPAGWLRARADQMGQQ